mgnify:CR=1 FL=1
MTEDQDLSDLLIAAQEENSRLRAALAEAKGALEPFAKEYGPWMDIFLECSTDDGNRSFVYGDFRTAATVFAKRETTP